MKLHFSKEWLRQKIEDEPDGMEAEAGSAFPIPIRQQKTPCGECHLKSGEACDVCGAVGN